MLIASHRHRSGDLRLWRELAAADTCRASEARMDQLVAKAQRDILRFASEHPACYAGVSWGKDSTVLCHLLQCVPDVPLMHLRPTTHNPDCDAVRDAYFAGWHGQAYHEIPMDYSHLDRLRMTEDEFDRQTDRVWHAAIRAFSERFPGGHLLGIRGEESTGRQWRMRRWGISSPMTCAPIGFWKTDDVFAYLARFNLPVHPAYACLGAGRWRRDRLRVDEIGGMRGGGGGRRAWEEEYYGDALRRIEAS